LVAIVAVVKEEVGVGIVDGGEVGLEVVGVVVEEEGDDDGGDGGGMEVWDVPLSIGQTKNNLQGEQATACCCSLSLAH
jgi:hypothetical protein